MHSFLLSDWNTIKGGATITSFAQDQSDYFDAGPFADLVFTYEFKNVVLAGDMKLFMETAPAKEEVLFVPMFNAGVVPTTTAMTPQKSIIGSITGSDIPVARWVRYRFKQTTAAAFEFTFRIWVAAGLMGR